MNEMKRQLMSNLDIFYESWQADIDNTLTRFRPSGFEPNDVLEGYSKLVQSIFDVVSEHIEIEDVVDSPVCLVGQNNREIRVMSRKLETQEIKTTAFLEALTNGEEYDAITDTLASSLLKQFDEYKQQGCRIWLYQLILPTGRLPGSSLAFRTRFAALHEDKL